jgi:hypothetical protein
MYFLCCLFKTYNHLVESPYEFIVHGHNVYNAIGSNFKPMNFVIFMQYLTRRLVVLSQTEHSSTYWAYSVAFLSRVLKHHNIVL